MCTVTFFPIGDQVVFTSNRDEAISRPLALAPAVSELNGKTLLFPKDPRAGGTWFAVTAEGTVAVLLNGAFKRHIPTGHYRMSRGLVLLDIISSDDAYAMLHTYDLRDIEPFTLLIYTCGSRHILTEFRWDGESRYLKDVDPTKPCIYSSATLYTPEIIHQREIWFSQFLKNGMDKTPSSIVDFHASAGRGDAENGLVMSRGKLLKTQCITQAVLMKTAIDFYHHDLISDTIDRKTLAILSKA